MKSVKMKALEKAHEKLLAVISVYGFETLLNPNAMGQGTTLSKEIIDIERHIFIIKSNEVWAIAAHFKGNYGLEKIHQQYSDMHNYALLVGQFLVSISSQKPFQQFALWFFSVLEAPFKLLAKLIKLPYMHFLYPKLF